MTYTSSRFRSSRHQPGLILRTPEEAILVPFWWDVLFLGGDTKGFFHEKQHKHFQVKSGKGGFFNGRRPKSSSKSSSSSSRSSSTSSTNGSKSETNSSNNSTNSSNRLKNIFACAGGEVVVVFAFSLLLCPIMPRKGWSVMETPAGWYQVLRGPHPKSEQWPRRQPWVLFVGAVACTGAAVTSSSTSMASCQQWEGSRRSAGCSSSPSRAFGERTTGIGRDRIHSGTRSQHSVEGSSSCSKRSLFGCAIDRMSKLSFSVLRNVFDRGTGGGEKRHWMELSRVCPGCAKRWRKHPDPPPHVGSPAVTQPAQIPVAVLSAEVRQLRARLAEVESERDALAKKRARCFSGVLQANQSVNVLGNHQTLDSRSAMMQTIDQGSSLAISNNRFSPLGP